MADDTHSDVQFRALFEALPIGVMAIDTTGYIVFLNAHVEKMFGYSREELIGEPIEALVPVRSRRMHADLAKTFTTGRHVRPRGTGRELVGARKDGSEFAVEIGLNPMTTSMGDFVVATIEDVTQRKQAAEETRVLEYARANIEICQRLGKPAAVVQCDGRVLFMNPHFRELDLQFVLKGDRIETANPTLNEFLKRGLASLNNGVNNNTVHPHMVLIAEGYRSLLFNIQSVKSSCGYALGILTVTKLGAKSLLPSDMVRSIFALTPAEARVATLIGSGLSPREAAAKLRISEGNVRTTLKRVFTRVGVSRQSELAVLFTKLLAFADSEIAPEPKGHERSHHLGAIMSPLNGLGESSHGLGDLRTGHDSKPRGLLARGD